MKNMTVPLPLAIALVLAIKEVIAGMPNPKQVAGKRAGAARQGGKNPAW